jgi:transposase-like protein
MDAAAFRVWLCEISRLTPAQREEAQEALSGRPEIEEVQATVEARVGGDRVCPHCGAGGAVSRGRANGLKRFRCRACGKSFNALTGTSLARLRHRDRWLTFAQALNTGDGVVESAERCDVAVSTAFRWRHRFLAGAAPVNPMLQGIVEADEAYVLRSEKGDRTLEREPRHRGGKATKRGLSHEQVPILVAADRGGSTLTAVLPSISGEAIKAVLEPVLRKDSLLVTDGAAYYPPCAAKLGITHEALNQSAGERIRGELHIQTVNSRHEQLKTFFRRFRGMATKYIPNYLNWFHLSPLQEATTPLAYLQHVCPLPAKGVMPS